MEKIKSKHYATFKRTLVHLAATAILGIAISIVVAILLRISLFEWDWDLYKEYMTAQNSTIIWLELSFIFIFYSWLTSLLKSKWGAASLFLTISVSIAIANYQKMFIRGEPIYPSDFDMIKVLPGIMKMVDLKIMILSTALIIIMLVLSVVLMKKDWSQRQKRPNRFVSILSIISFLILSYSLAVFYNFNQPDNIVRAAFDPHVQWIHWSQQENYQTNGFISGFLYNLPGQPIEKPIGYTSSKLNEIVTEYMQIAQQKNKLIENRKTLNPNIIFIMNESFSDPKNLDDINISSDPISYFSELSEKNLSGNVLISGYGGGTANAEFEALTSISLESLSSNITTPYIQMNHLMEHTPNIVTQLKNKNYHTVAIHPFNTTMYKRPDVYTSLGFDEFIYDETMKSREYHENNEYISDRSAYNEILDQLKQTTQKKFIHLVTMHGHTSYHGNYDQLKFEVSASNNENIEIIEQYYQRLSYSDEDFQYFIKEINLLEEDTLVVFWGDHLPGIYTDEIFKKKYKYDMYETPILFYSNFETEYLEQDLEITSPIYIMSYISDILNEPVSGYTAFMKDMEAHVSAFKRGLYVESFTGAIVDERDKLTKKSQEILNQYDMILYDILSGRRETTELGFFEIPY